MVNEMINEKRLLLDEIISIRQEFSKSESNVTISRLKVTLCLLHNLVIKAKDKLN